MKVRGGPTLYGHTIGIITLDTQFPRIPGDIGNATTWSFPVRYRVVPKASPERVVRQQAAGLLEPFLRAAHDLVQDGVRAITTSCGFLSLYQQETGSCRASTGFYLQPDANPSGRSYAARRTEDWRDDH